MTARSNTTKQPPATLSWRDVLPIHPAANLFPLMSRDELKALGEDIKKNGLTSPIALWTVDAEKLFVLDGRNRLDAMGAVTIENPGVLGTIVVADGTKIDTCSGDSDAEAVKLLFADEVDPYAYVVSANVHRRHLTAEQKRDLIAELIKATPEKSNRQIANQAKVFSPPTVAKVRKQLEDKGDVKKVYTSIDTKGRRQPTHKSKPVSSPGFDAACELAKRLGREVIQLKSRSFRLTSPDDGPGICFPSLKRLNEALKDVESEAEASAEKRKAEHAAADAPPADTKAEVNAKDTTLDEFDGHVLRLLQMTSKTKPARFAKTGAEIPHLMRLGNFLAEVAEAVEATPSYGQDIAR